MTSYYLKLFVEILNDPKIMSLPDWAFRRFIEYLLIAKDFDQDGKLPPVVEIAWRLHLQDKQVEEGLSALSQVGVVLFDEENNCWVIKNFTKRQAAVSSTERSKEYRKRERNETLQDRCETCNETATLPSPLLSSDSLIKLKELDSFDQIQEIAIRLTGLMVLQSDLKTLYDWEREKVIEDDIRGALQWRTDNDKPPIKTISQLAGGVKTERAKRIQGGDGRELPGKLPQKPDGMDDEVFQAFEYLRLNRYRDDVRGRATNRLDRLKFLHEKGLAMEVEK